MPAFKRSTILLFSGSEDIPSHQARIVLAEKAINVEIVEVDLDNPSEDFLEISPYGELPVLVDRDLVIYNVHIIMDYLDERFPHPPLLSVYPMMRAKLRLMMYRMDQDWYSQVHIIQKGSPTEAENARKVLVDSFLKIAPTFEQMDYFFSEDFTLVDCYFAPLLLRLPILGIELPERAAPLIRYADALFNKDAFKASLTEAEQELRPDLL